MKNFEIAIISLNNWEKRIIRLLEDHGGELTQTDIRAQTGLSRSNLSKYINSLFEKEIIAKVPFERTNKIILIKKIVG